jgi:hypothetical protein
MSWIRNTAENKDFQKFQMEQVGNKSTIGNLMLPSYTHVASH